MQHKYYRKQNDILNEMLNKIDTVNTQEGSFIWQEQTPVSFELEKHSLKMDELLARVFASSALENGFEEEFIRRCEEHGVDRKPALYASGVETFIGTKDTVIPVGTKISDKKTGLIYTTTIEGTIGEDGTVDVLCVAAQKGSKYNAEPNTIEYMPVSLIGVTGCTNKDKFTGGTNIESLEDLYYRYCLKIRTPATSGNIYHYQQWCLSVDGIGACRVYETTNEKFEKQNGHVLCVLADSERRAVTQEQIDKVLEYIETVRPVGAKVHGVSAEELALNIDVTVSYNSKQYTLQQVQDTIEKNITKYLKALAFTQDYVSYAKLGVLIFESEGVIDYKDLKVNDTQTNIAIADNKIAVLGTITLNSAI